MYLIATECKQKQKKIQGCIQQLKSVIFIESIMSNKQICVNCSGGRKKCLTMYIG